MNVLRLWCFLAAVSFSCAAYGADALKLALVGEKNAVDSATAELSEVDAVELFERNEIEKVLKEHELNTLSGSKLARLFPHADAAAVFYAKSGCVMVFDLKSALILACGKTGNPGKFIQNALAKRSLPRSGVLLSFGMIRHTGSDGDTRAADDFLFELTSLLTSDPKIVMADRVELEQVLRERRLSGKIFLPLPSERMLDLEVSPGGETGKIGLKFRVVLPSGRELGRGVLPENAAAEDAARQIRSILAAPATGAGDADRKKEAERHFKEFLRLVNDGTSSSSLSGRKLEVYPMAMKELQAALALNPENVEYRATEIRFRWKEACRDNLSFEKRMDLNERFLHEAELFLREFPDTEYNIYSPGDWLYIAGKVSVVRRSRCEEYVDEGQFYSQKKLSGAKKERYRAFYKEYLRCWKADLLRRIRLKYPSFFPSVDGVNSPEELQCFLMFPRYIINFFVYRDLLEELPREHEFLMNCTRIAAKLARRDPNFIVRSGEGQKSIRFRVSDGLHFSFEDDRDNDEWFQYAGAILLPLIRRDYPELRKLADETKDTKTTLRAITWKAILDWEDSAKTDADLDRIVYHMLDESEKQTAERVRVRTYNGWIHADWMLTTFRIVCRPEKMVKSFRYHIRQIYRYQVAHGCKTQVAVLRAVTFGGEEAWKECIPGNEHYLRPYLKGAAKSPDVHISNILTEILTRTEDGRALLPLFNKEWDMRTIPAHGITISGTRHNGKLYLLGTGERDTVQTGHRPKLLHLSVFDPKTETLEKLPSPKGSLYDLQADQCVIGGQSSTDITAYGNDLIAGGRKKIYLFDLAKNEWRYLDNIAGEYAAGTAVVGGRLYYLCGGTAHFSPNRRLGLYSCRPDGSDRKTHFDPERLFKENDADRLPFSSGIVSQLIVRGETLIFSVGTLNQPATVFAFDTRTGKIRTIMTTRSGFTGLFLRDVGDAILCCPDGNRDIFLLKGDDFTRVPLIRSELAPPLNFAGGMLASTPFSLSPTLHSVKDKNTESPLLPYAADAFYFEEQDLWVFPSDVDQTLLLARRKKGK